MNEINTLLNELRDGVGHRLADGVVASLATLFFSLSLCYRWAAGSAIVVEFFFFTPLVLYSSGSLFLWFFTPLVLFCSSRRLLLDLMSCISFFFHIQSQLFFRLLDTVST
jgi:hypothetical protein